MGADGSGDLSVMSRGVPLMKRALYDPNVQTFACLDGSRVIPVRQVNDDYCDCKDGSDEPGTSACPQVRIDFRNRGRVTSDMLLNNPLSVRLSVGIHYY